MTGMLRQCCFSNGQIKNGTMNITELEVYSVTGMLPRSGHQQWLDQQSYHEGNRTRGVQSDRYVTTVRVSAMIRSAMVP